MLEALLSAGADLNARGDFGYTPLHFAVWGRVRPMAVTVLLDAGADPDARTDDGASPLHWVAATHGDVGIATALLKAGRGPQSAGPERLLAPA